MRYLIASMIMCCCVTAGYSQEETTTTEAPVEVSTTTSEDTGCGEVAVGTDSKQMEFDCGCGNKDKKPKI